MELLAETTGRKKNQTLRQSLHSSAHRGKAPERPLPYKHPTTGVYYCDFYDARGVRVRKSLRTRSKRVAQQREDAMRLRALEGRLGLPQSKPATHEAEQLALDYLADLATRAKPKHVAEVRRTVLRYVEATTARSAALLTRESAEAWLASERFSWRQPKGEAPPTPASARTCNKRRAALRAFGNWLAQRGHVDANPYGQLPRATGDTKHPRRVPTEAEWAAILEAAPEYRRLWYRFLAGTGLRCGESCEVTWGDLDLGGEPTLRVRASVSKTGDEVALPLALPVRDELVRWRDGELDLGPYRKRARLRLASREHDAAVFPYRPILRTWRADLERAGVPYRTARGFLDLHSLRRKFASDLVAADVAPSVTHELMRHSDYSMTQRAYVEAREQAKRDALAAAVGAVGGQSPATGAP